MTVKHPLAELLVNSPRSFTQTDAVDTRLAETISQALSNISVQGDGNGSVELCALMCRRVLEGSATALLCRVDPLRVLLTYKQQLDGSYRIEQRNKLSIQWTGDIFAKETGAFNLDSETDPGKVSRALFSNTTENILWIPLIQNALDYFGALDGEVGNSWIAEWSSKTATDCYKSSISHIEQAFSAVSKRIHFESLIHHSELAYKDIFEYFGRAVKAYTLLGFAMSYAECQDTPERVKMLQSRLNEICSLIGGVNDLHQ
jgi:hypothetical protein